MVLTQMVGKKRPFLRGLLLTIFTFGIYGIYWMYKAHDELYKQFELQKEGRDEGILWLILGLVLFPLQFVYSWIFAGNVEYLRQRLDLPRRVTAGRFVGLQLGGYLVFFVGYVPLLIGMLAVGETATEEEVFAAMGAGFALFAVAAVAATGLLMFAYYQLQAGINEIWDAYASRMQTLTQPAPTASSAVTATPGAYTYWGDLKPAAPALSAPHVRARADALARDASGVALPRELPDLLARGEAGDQAALAAAAALLDGVDRSIRERARLSAEMDEIERKQGRLAGRLANGEVDNAAYQAARDELDRERSRLRAKLAELDERARSPSGP